MLRQLKQYFSITSTLVAVLSVSPTLRADCFNGSGKAGVIKNLDRPWVFTVYLPEKAGEPGHYRVKSFGVNLEGRLDCKGSKTYCESERGSVNLKKTANGLEMKFSRDLAVEKRNTDENEVRQPSNERESKVVQIFNLPTVHSDICYDAFFKTTSYDDYAKAHGNQITFPLERSASAESAPQ